MCVCVCVCVCDLCTLVLIHKPAQQRPESNTRAIEEATKHPLSRGLTFRREELCLE